MQRIREYNKCLPVNINMEDDNTEYEGIVTSEQLYKQMQKAGQMTKEYITKMYPKNEEYEKTEAQRIADETITQQFYNADQSNKEKIEAIYLRNKNNAALQNSVREIAKLKEQEKLHMENIEKQMLKYERDMYKKKAEEKDIYNNK